MCQTSPLTKFFGGWEKASHPLKGIQRLPNTTKREIKWAKKYRKLPTKKILFTDESRAALDKPYNWSKGWVVIGHPRPTSIRRQQGGGSIMIWIGIINDQNVGPIRVPEGVKLTSVVYCNLYGPVLMNWL